MASTTWPQHVKDTAALSTPIHPSLFPLQPCKFSAISFQPPDLALVIAYAWNATPLECHRAPQNVTFTVTFLTILCNVPSPSLPITLPTTSFYRTHITVRNNVGNYLLPWFISVSPPRTKASWGQGLSLSCPQAYEYISSAWNCVWQNCQCIWKSGKWQQWVMRTGCNARGRSLASMI